MVGIKNNPIKELYLAKNIEDLQKQMKIRLTMAQSTLKNGF